MLDDGNTFLPEERSVPAACNRRERALHPATKKASLGTATESSVFSLRYVLSNSTYVRKLYIKANVAAVLFPWSSNGLKALSNSKLQTTRAGAFAMRQIVVVRDEQGRHWNVVYEYFQGKGQKHRRLNAGWSQFCKANDLRVGDRICIELRKVSQDFVVVIHKI